MNYIIYTSLISKFIIIKEKTSKVIKEIVQRKKIEKVLKTETNDVDANLIGKMHWHSKFIASQVDMAGYGCSNTVKPVLGGDPQDLVTN